MAREYKARIIETPNRANDWSYLIAIYYRSPNLGVCDVEYMHIARTDANEFSQSLACSEALTSYLKGK